MAKQRITPIMKTDVERVIKQLKIANNELLPSEDEALQGISKATNKPLSTGEPKSYGRPPKENAIGRVKFTTALQSHYVKWLKIQAANTGVSVADVVEKAIAAYKHEKDMDR
jgi:hypothetical protein